MSCVPAPACKAALLEASALWPKRTAASDGICGDARHQARKSDHNSGNAFDLTHDPVHGCDAHLLVQNLAANKDSRVKYIISQRQIWNPLVGSAAAYAHARSQGAGRIAALRAAIPGWRRYTGTNPHEKHAHVSIKTAARNNLAPWWKAQAPPPPPPLAKPVIVIIGEEEDMPTLKDAYLEVSTNSAGNGFAHFKGPGVYEGHFPDIPKVKFRNRRSVQFHGNYVPKEPYGKAGAVLRVLDWEGYLFVEILGGTPGKQGLHIQYVE